MSDLQQVYERLVDSEAFAGSHVSLDRDHCGEEYVAVAPNWIDRAGLALALEAAQDLELSVALTKDGLRFDRMTGGTVLGVESVKRSIREEQDPDG